MNVPFMVLIFLGQSETLKFKLNTYVPDLKNVANICVIHSCQILKIPREFRNVVDIYLSEFYFRYVLSLVKCPLPF